LFHSLKNCCRNPLNATGSLVDNAMNQSKTFLWYKSFKDGQMSVNDDERSGQPSTSTTPENIAKVG
jgi:hypothetical protein